MRDLLDKLGNLGIIPVVMLERLEDSKYLATALLELLLNAPSLEGFRFQYH